MPALLSKPSPSVFAGPEASLAANGLGGKQQSVLGLGNARQSDLPRQGPRARSRCWQLLLGSRGTQ
eukprot:13839732-Alexandrium_andersonii.AAC.1